MSKKRLEMTEELQASIRRGVGDKFLETDNLVVFEAKMLSTEAIKKPGFFNKGRVTEQTLRQMVNLLNAEGGAIPLHIMHNESVLPVGKVFAASIENMANGETAIRGMFYLTADQTEVVSKIETSIVDEVSVGLKTKHAFCSECNFDYYGPDATYMNYYDLTCENGHVLGQDGVHLRLSEVEDFAELSLVGRGAAKNAKILPRDKQSQGSNQNRLAANGVHFDAMVLRASMKIEADVQPSTTTIGDNMDVKELLAKVEASASALGKNEIQLSQANDKIEGLNAEIVKVKAELTAAQTELVSFKEANAEQAKLKTELDETKKLLADAEAKLMPHVEAALVASGVSKDSIKDLKLNQMVDLIEEKGLKLHQVIGGNSPKDVPNKSAVSDAYKQSFKSRI